MNTKKADSPKTISIKNVHHNIRTLTMCTFETWSFFNLVRFLHIFYFNFTADVVAYLLVKQMEFSNCICTHGYR